MLDLQLECPIRGVSSGILTVSATCLPALCIRLFYQEKDSSLCVKVIILHSYRIYIEEYT